MTTDSSSSHSPLPPPMDGFDRLGYYLRSLLILGAVLFLMFWAIAPIVALFRAKCDDPCIVCRPLSPQKAEVDQYFRPVSCRGVINRIENKGYRGHKYSTRFHMRAMPGFPYQRLHPEFLSSEMHFDSHGDNWVGLNARFEEKIAVGDTFLKRSGEIFFYVLRRQGDTLIGELQHPGYNAGLDCTFDRSSGELCYTRDPNRRKRRH